MPSNKGHPSENDRKAQAVADNKNSIYITAHLITDWLTRRGPHQYPFDY